MKSMRLRYLNGIVALYVCIIAGSCFAMRVSAAELIERSTHESDQDKMSPSIELEALREEILAVRKDIGQTKSVLGVLRLKLSQQGEVAGSSSETIQIQGKQINQDVSRIEQALAASEVYTRDNRPLPNDIGYGELELLRQLGVLLKLVELREEFPVDNDITQNLVGSGRIKQQIQDLKESGIEQPAKMSGVEKREGNRPILRPLGNKVGKAMRNPAR